MDNNDLLTSYGPLVGAAALVIVLAGQHDNHFWRLIVLWIWKNLSTYAATVVVAGSAAYSLVMVMVMVIQILTAVIIWWMPQFANWKYQTRQGCVLITGCDSGMGQATVVYLAQTQAPPNQYDHIFAACFNTKAAREAFEGLLTADQLECVTFVPLDVTNETSVQSASTLVQDYLRRNSTHLTGVVQFHGVAFNGPAQYMPISMYERQLQVNFVGNMRVTQAFLNMLRESSDGANHQTRLIMTGTGGGPCTPCPPLLTAYMASKFATEAYLQALRQELYMTGTGIECCMINPGFVKPTMLMAEGEKLTANMWKATGDKAKQEFGPLLQHFMKYSSLQPGTHVSEVAKAAEHGLLAKIPRTSYKVGIDSKLAPIVGMMPTGMRETIARHGIYGILSPAGTVKGYQV